MGRANKKELRINLFRVDKKMYNGAPISQGLLPFVSLVLEKKPSIYPLMNAKNRELLVGGVRGYTFVWTKTKKHCFGHMHIGKKVFSLQECLLVRGLSRSVQVKILLHVMIHAYIDATGGLRTENRSHGLNFTMEVERINSRLGCNILDESDIDWSKLGPGKHKFVCERCAKEFVRTVNRRRDFAFYAWFAIHQSSCGGEFIRE